MHSTAFGQFFKKQSTSGQLLYGGTFVHSASIIVLVLVMLPACRAFFQAFLDLPLFSTPSLGDSSTADFVALHCSPFWATHYVQVTLILSSSSFNFGPSFQDLVVVLGLSFRDLEWVLGIRDTLSFLYKSPITGVNINQLSTRNLWQSIKTLKIIKPIPDKSEALLQMHKVRNNMLKEIWSFLDEIDSLL